VGPEPAIKVCIDRASDFPRELDEGTLRKKVNEAFGKWKTYLTDKKAAYFRNTFGGPGAAPQFDPVTFVFDLDWKAHCDGTTDELRFCFGSSPDRVLEAKKHYDNPMAFAQRETYDLAQGRGTGFIWFSSAIGPDGIPKKPGLDFFGPALDPNQSFWSFNPNA